jgi:hypothetical protein
MAEPGIKLSRVKQISFKKIGRKASVFNKKAK